MLPERDEWQLMRKQFTDTYEEEREFELELDQDYINFIQQSFLKQDGEDHKRVLLRNLDVPAHRQLLADLVAEKQYATARVILWHLDEYARLFPGRQA